VRTAGVHTIAVGGADVPDLAPILSSEGIGAADLESADLVVVICDDYLTPALADVDARCRRAGRPWLLAKLGGTGLWIGPVFGADGAGCWTCLAHRLWQHRHAEAHVQRSLGLAGIPVNRPRVSAPGLRRPGCPAGRPRGGEMARRLPL